MQIPFKFDAALKCFIGTVLMKCGSGLIVTWGKTNIYYYSYYKHQEIDLPIAYNTVPVALIALPLAFITLVSMKFAKRIGHQLLIRVCAVLQTISLLISAFMPTYLLFIVFYLVFPAFYFSLSAYPILGCVYSHYPKKEGRVTGVVLGMLSFATLTYILVITFLSNPHNKEADLEAHMGKQTFKYFSNEVGQNVPYAVLTVTIVSGLCLIIGSLLMSFNNSPIGNPQELIDEEIKPNHQTSIELVVMEKTEVKADEIKADQNKSKVPLLEKKSSDSTELKKAMSSSQFKIIFSAQFTLFFFVITLGMNFKSYALSKFNNDHFVTLVDTIALVLQGLLSVLWGIITDKADFVYLFTGLYFLSGCFVILLALTSGQVCFTIFYLLVSLFDKGSMVVTGPGLVRIFGNDIGTQLLPMVNIGVLASLLLSPVFQVAMMSFMDFDYVLAVCGVFILCASYFNTKLMMQYSIKELS